MTLRHPVGGAPTRPAEDRTAYLDGWAYEECGFERKPSNDK